VDERVEASTMLTGPMPAYTGDRAAVSEFKWGLIYIHAECVLDKFRLLTNLQVEEVETVLIFHLRTLFQIFTVQLNVLSAVNFHMLFARFDRCAWIVLL
jgi:hypothetical protein